MTLAAHTVFSLIFESKIFLFKIRHFLDCVTTKRLRETLWLADFFYDHSHCTLFHGQQSSLFDISASIIHHSVIGPATYVVTAGDLTSCVSGNFLCKYADDTYLIIPASNESCRHIELVNIENWAKQNNLKLNCSKSCLIVFTNRRRRRWHAPEPPPLHCQESCPVEPEDARRGHC